MFVLPISIFQEEWFNAVPFHQVSLLTHQCIYYQRQQRFLLHVFHPISTISLLQSVMRAGA